jgi:hypothetical protein
VLLFIYIYIYRQKRTGGKGQAEQDGQNRTAELDRQILDRRIRIGGIRLASETP